MWTRCNESTHPSTDKRYTSFRSNAANVNAPSKLAVFSLTNIGQGSILTGSVGIKFGASILRFPSEKDSIDTSTQWTSEVIFNIAIVEFGYAYIRFTVFLLISISGIEIQFEPIITVNSTLMSSTIGASFTKFVSLKLNAV